MALNGLENRTCFGMTEFDSLTHRHFGDAGIGAPSAPLRRGSVTGCAFESRRLRHHENGVRHTTAWRPDVVGLLVPLSTRWPAFDSSETRAETVWCLRPVAVSSSSQVMPAAAVRTWVQILWRSVSTAGSIDTAAALDVSEPRTNGTDDDSSS